MKREVIRVAVPVINNTRSDIMPTKAHGKSGKTRRRNERRATKVDIRLGRFDQ